AQTEVCAGGTHMMKGLYPCKHVKPFRLGSADTLPGLELAERAGIGVEVNTTRDAADDARRADLPIGPVAATAAGHPGVAAGAAAPRIAGVEVFTIVVGDERGEINTASLVVFDQVASTRAGAAIDHRM